jgi:hypothetical protein
LINLLIHKKEHINNIIIPIFKNYNLLTSKGLDFIIFEKCFLIYINNHLTQEEKINQINLIKLEKINYIPFLLTIEKPINYIHKS